MTTIGQPRNMNQNSFKWILLFSAALVTVAYGANTTVHEACYNIESIDGSSYSLAPLLLHKGQLAFNYKDSKNTSYELLLSVCSNNICFGRSAAACLCNKGKGDRCVAWFPFGEFTPSSITALNDGGGVQFTYKSAGTPYWTILHLLCDYNSVGTSNYDMVIDADSKGFMEKISLTIRTEAACAIKVPISGGTIFLLIVLCGGALYIIGGVMYNKFSLMKEGFEVLPHSAFWADLPNLVKEGFAYSFSRRSGSSAAPANYENVSA